MNCIKCNAVLTELNTEKDRSLKRGYRSKCKPCINTYKRAKAKKVYKRIKCVYCAKEFRGIGTRKLCSPKCYLLFYSCEIDNGCITWNGQYRNTPIICFGNQKISARKLLLSEINVSLPRGSFVELTCNNEKCVNTDHFKIKKSLPENGNVTRRKLTKDLMLQIKEKYEQHNWSKSEIARYFGLNHMLVGNFLRKKHYKNIKFELDIELENHDICIQCSKQHDNLGSQYCSMDCMTQYLTKE